MMPVTTISVPCAPESNPPAATGLSSAVPKGIGVGIGVAVGAADVVGCSGGAVGIGIDVCIPDKDDLGVLVEALGVVGVEVDIGWLAVDAPLVRCSNRLQARTETSNRSVSPFPSA